MQIYIESRIAMRDVEVQRKRNELKQIITI